MNTSWYSLGGRNGIYGRSYLDSFIETKYQFPYFNESKIYFYKISLNHSRRIRKENQGNLRNLVIDLNFMPMSVPFSSYLVQSSILECVCLKHSVYLTMSRSLYFPTFPTSTLTANSLNISRIKFNILLIVLQCNISSITRVDTAPYRKLSKLNTDCDRLTCSHPQWKLISRDLLF